MLVANVVEIILEHKQAKAFRPANKGKNAAIIFESLDPLHLENKE